MVAVRTQIYWMLLAAAILVHAQPRQWNWEKLTLPPPYDRGFYLDITFLPSNPQYGWACGFSGYVIRTSDGGNTWEGTIIPNADQLESIIFVNERVGYCSGTNNGNPNLGGIYKSTDGGRSWREITPVVSVGGVPQRAPVWGCYFLDENTGMVVGGGCDGWAQLFFRTTDGGATWSLFTATEPQTGMSHVLLYDTNGLGYASSSGRIWRTLDGGRSWQVYAVTGPAFWQENLATINNTFLVATAGNTCTGGTGNIGDIRLSLDGGRSWWLYPTAASMFGTFLVSGDAGWAVGWNRAVYRVAYNRINGQVTATPYRCGLEPGSNYDDVWFINDTLGYLVGDGIYRTTMRDLLEPIIVSSTGRFVACDGESITLSVVKGDRVRQPYTEYVWSTGERTPTIVVSRGGTYQVEVRDPDACYGKSAIVTVTEAPSPNVEIHLLTSDTACDGDTIIVEATVDSSLVSIAEFGWVGRQDRSMQLAVVAHSNIGRYTFQAFVRGVNGCEGVSRSLSVAVRPRLVPTITVEPPLVARDNGSLVLCPGSQVELRASDGFAEYRWNTGDITPRIVVTEPGTYTVTVSNRTDQFCPGTSAPITIVVGDTVRPVIMSERGFRFCDGDRIVLRTDRQYQQYRWSTGEQTSRITVTQAGQYWVQVTDEYNCAGQSEPIAVDVDPNPIEIVSVGGSTWQFEPTAATMMRCDSLLVRNSGSQLLVLSTTRLERNIEFSVPQVQLPLQIEPGQERWLRVCFLPSILGEQRDTLWLADASAYCSRTLALIGVCSANRYAAQSSCDVGIGAETAQFAVAGLIVMPPYPNPATEQAVLTVARPVSSVYVNATDGRQYEFCSVSRASGGDVVQCRVDMLPSGLYTIVVSIGTQVLALPIVVLH
ncbi:MAG: YCF48-related protein [Chlorobi bacterium]|nr:YCF48-related protein [Chlorobiota bacterium]